MIREAEVRVTLPDEPPELTPELCRALLGFLRRAAERQRADRERMTSC